MPGKRLLTNTIQTTSRGDLLSNYLLAFGNSETIERVKNIFTNENDAIVMETPGAGGYGNPKKRTKNNILKDKISGKFSNSFLKKYY